MSNNATQSDKKVLNCRLTPLLAQKFENIKESTGYTSDTECLRYMIHTFESTADNLDKRIGKQLDEFKKLLPLIKKRYGGRWPTIDEQLADMGE